jgi:hypothetical protein
MRNFDSIRFESRGYSEAHLLLCFKFFSRWNEHAIRTLQERYTLSVCTIRDALASYDARKTSELISLTRSETNSSVVLLDPEFCYHINPVLVRELAKESLVGLFIFDHHIDGNNLCLIREAHFTLCACPQLTERLRSRGYTCFWFPLENSAFYAGETDLTYKFDLSFFGNLLNGREQFLSRLIDRKRFSVSISSKNSISYRELSSFVRASMCSINLSRVYSPFNGNAEFFDIEVDDEGRSFTRVLKGRISESAFCGRLCISEYSPQLRYLGIDAVVPQFVGLEDLIELSEYCLHIGNFRSLSEHFITKVCDVYSASRVMKSVDICAIKNNSVELPYYPPFSLQMAERYIHAAQSKLDPECRIVEVNALLDYFQIEHIGDGNSRRPKIVHNK